MKEISFYKMVASGNDFVVVDNRKKAVSNPSSFAKAVCHRHSGIGGDGVLLLESSKQADFKMRILNADGSEAEACGNGFRCIALLAHQKFDFPRRQRFESLAGVIDADIHGARVRVRLMDPKDFKERQKIKVGQKELSYYFIRVGVPHVVIFVEGLWKLPVFEIGRAIRFHSEFQPAGTNVNFVEVTGSNSICVETYERGVEENTQACGTGSTASAIVSVVAGYVKTPVEVKTRGGEILTVDFLRKGDPVQDVYLEGDAQLVYEGKISI